MPKFRVRAKSQQTYTQFFDVHATTPEEALQLVRNGDVEITYERFDDIDNFEPLDAHRVEPRPRDPRERALLALALV